MDLNVENWEYDFECQTEKCDFERQTENWWWLWTSKLGSNDDDSERQPENTMMALNAETKK